LQTALTELQALDQSAVAKSAKPDLIAEAVCLAKLNLLQKFIDEHREPI